MDWSSLLGGMMGGGGSSGGSSGGSGGGGDTTKASMGGFQVPSMSGIGMKLNEQNNASRNQLLKNYGQSGSGSGNNFAPQQQSGSSLSDLLKGILNNTGSDKTPTNGGDPYASETGFMSGNYQPMNSSKLGMYEDNGMPKNNYGLGLQ